MSRDWDDEEDDADGFDEDRYDPDDPETYPEGLYTDDEPGTVPCPHCGKDVLEDSERCPNCEMYLSKEDAPVESRSGPWMMVLVLALLGVLMWIIGNQ